jgi:hypothetical protein
MSIESPRLPRGRPSGIARTVYDTELKLFCEQIVKIKSRLDFEVSSRGWCYIWKSTDLVRATSILLRPLSPSAADAVFSRWTSWRRTARVRKTHGSEAAP